MYYVYILRCATNTYYTGITDNFTRRMTEHKNGLSLFTKGRLPVDLVYYEIANTRIEARKREVVIKDMNQNKKQVLIEQFVLEKFTSSVSEKRE